MSLFCEITIYLAVIGSVARRYGMCVVFGCDESNIVGAMIVVLKHLFDSPDFVSFTRKYR